MYIYKYKYIYIDINMNIRLYVHTHTSTYTNMDIRLFIPIISSSLISSPSNTISAFSANKAILTDITPLQLIRPDNHNDDDDVYLNSVEQLFSNCCQLIIIQYSNKNNYNRLQ
jgi:hypothetical protein